MRRYVTLSYVLSGKWLIDEAFAESFYPSILNMMGGVSAAQDDDENKEAAPVPVSNNPLFYFVSDRGEAAPPENAPEGSVAVISVFGAITKYDYCGSAGTLTKASLLQRCNANPNIKGVILNIDSGGGEGGACEILTTAIKQANKPVTALVSGMAASAAYWIASACDRIVVSGETSSLGSIGSYVTIANFSEYYKQMGIDVRRIYAPQSDLKNKGYEDALAGKDDAIKANLEKYTNFFINAVKANRDITEPNAFKGAMFYAREAVAAGLADEIGDIETCIAHMSAPEQVNNNTKNMKISLLATWTSLLAFFGAKATEGSATVEHETNSEELARLNTALTEAETLRTKVSQLEGELNTTKASLQTATTRVSELEEQLPTKAAAKPASEKGDSFDTVDSEFLTQADIDAKNKRAQIYPETK